MSFNKINKWFTFLSTCGVLLLFFIMTILYFSLANKQDTTLYNNYVDMYNNLWSFENNQVVFSTLLLPFRNVLINVLGLNGGALTIVNNFFGCMVYMFILLFIQCFLNVLFFVPRIIIKFMHKIGGIDNE